MDCEQLTNVNLNNLIVPNETNTGSDKSASECSDSSCDFEFLQTNSSLNPIRTNVQNDDDMIIVNAMKLTESESENSVVAESEHVLKSFSSEVDGSESSCKSDHMLDDWDMMDSSDDDGVEIIERERARPSYALIKIDKAAEAEAQNSIPMTLSLITADKHVQTNDLVEADSSPELQQPIADSATLTESSIPSPKLNTNAWIFDGFLVGAIFASLILLYYTADCIIKEFSRPPLKPNAEEANDAVMDFMVHVVRDFNNRMEELQRNIDYFAENQNQGLTARNPEELKEYLRQDLAAMNTFFDRFREEGKRVFANDKVLYQQIEMLRDNVFVLNVHDFVLNSPEQSLLPKSIFKLVSMVERIPPCNPSVTDEQLPIPCRDDNHKVKLMFHRNHLVSINLHSEVFYHKVSMKFELPDENAPSPDSDALTAAKDANTFVHDCDNFSKNYRSNFCSRTDSKECREQTVVDDDKNNEKTCSHYADDLLSASQSESTSSSNDVNIENDDTKTLKMVREFRTMVKKFKADFESFYDFCMKAESSESEEQDRVEDDTTDATNESPERESLDKNIENDASSVSTEDQPKVISGDWFFDLNAARAKLRLYYENTVSGDWSLKLGKAREKLRQRFTDNENKSTKNDRKDRKSKKNKRWEMPTSDQLKENIKKFSSKWKSQFKKMQEDFVHKYNKYVPSSWQFDFQNRWFYS